MSASSLFSHGLSEIVLMVRDVPQSAEFYRAVVGLVPAREANEEWAWFWAGPPAGGRREQAGIIPIGAWSLGSQRMKGEVFMGTDSHHTGGVALRWPVWIGIVCDDLEQQRHFYRDVLGLSELKAGANWVWFDFGGRLLELLAKSPLPQYASRMVSFAFEVEDIRSARAELIRRGVEPVTEIEGGPEALQYWTYFKDAEGNLFELVQRVVT